jgi:uncharacterized protein
MHVFDRSSVIICDRDRLYQYHANPGALNRLIPPWEKISIECRSDSLSVGSEVTIRNSVFGVPVRWFARHTILDIPRHFQDIQLSGPFHSWIHDHHFETLPDSYSQLQDHIQFRLKLEPFGRVALPIVRSKLNSMFDYRHRTTAADLQLQHFLKPWTPNRPLRIGVTGSNGMIGRRLIDLISVLGHQAIRILRPSSVDRAPDFPLNAQTVRWDASAGFDDLASVQGLDAVIHLAGKGIASSRWNASIKNAIRVSRVEGTRALVQDLCKLESPPKVFVSASGAGIYGDRGEDVCDEATSLGNDYLAKLARDWESAAQSFEASGGRVAIGRLGIALHPREGALAKLLTPFKLGVGGPIGNGKQYWSWIDVDDAAAGFLYLAINPNCTGAYNLVAPEQTTNRQFSKILGKVLARPSLLPAPAFALRLLLGEMADAMLLSSTRVSCSRLIRDHFPFRSPTLEVCLRHVLGR